MGSFELTSRVYPGFAVVALAGELDAAGARAAAAVFCVYANVAAAVGAVGCGSHPCAACTRAGLSGPRR